MAVNLRRLHVQQETGDHRLRPFQVAFGQTQAEDGAAHPRAREPLPDSFGQRRVHKTRYLSAATRWPLSTTSRLSLLMLIKNHSSPRGAGPPLTAPCSSKTLP